MQVLIGVNFLDTVSTPLIKWVDSDNKKTSAFWSGHMRVKKHCPRSAVVRLRVARLWGGSGPVNEKGAALMEAALTAPFILLLVLGVIQYGFILAGFVSLRSATAVTARYVTLIKPTTLASDSTTIRSILDPALQPLLDPLKVSAVTVTDDPGGLAGGRSVDVVYRMPMFFPLVVPGVQNDGTLPLRATVVMR